VNFESTHRLNKIGFLSRILVGAAAIMVACSSGGGNQAAPPRLTVVIVVDQMCSHHAVRYRDLFSGGLQRLLDGGAVFTNARHDHAKTHTSPGHATISTGLYPARHGIVANSWYDRTRSFETTYSARDKNAPTVGRLDQPGASPRQMLRSALGDLLKGHSARSRVFSVALKDYAAVLMGGLSPDAAFWYDDENGTFCSSTYYMNAYPAWVETFNGGRPADDYLDAVWTRSMPEEAYERSRPDKFSAELDGEHTTFPYPVDEAAKAQGEEFYGFLRSTPFADELALRFAAAMVAGEGLGGDDDPDLLFVGCSAADFIGHGWGPYSQEVEDYYIKLDRYLETFLGMLDEQVGPDNYVVVLTSDHGVDPLPESLAGEFDGAERIDRKRYYADVDRVAEEVAREFGIERPLFAHRSRGLVLDPVAAAESGVSAAVLRGRIAQGIEEISYVQEVYTYDELAGGTSSPASDATAGKNKQYLRLVQNGFHEERSPDIYVVFKEHRLMMGSSHGTTHGSPHDYDRHVPLVFWGRGIGAVTVETNVTTVDVAPTLCDLLGIEVPRNLDGRSLAAELAGSIAEKH